MNPDSPQNPQEKLEASLTSLLLGEMPHEQAAALHQKIAGDPELSKLYDRLKETIGVVRETMHAPAESNAEPAEPLKLSDERRQMLLAQFRTVVPEELDRPKSRVRITILELAIAASVVAILGALMLPALSKAKSKAQRLAALNEESFLQKSVPVTDSIYAKRRTESAARNSSFASAPSNVSSANVVGYYAVPVEPNGTTDRHKRIVTVRPVASPEPDAYSLKSMPQGVNNDHDAHGGQLTFSTASAQRGSVIVLPPSEQPVASPANAASSAGTFQAGIPANHSDTLWESAETSRQLTKAAPVAGLSGSDEPAVALKFRTWSLEKSGDLPQITSAPKPAEGRPDSTHLSWSGEPPMGGEKRHNGDTFGLADGKVSSTAASTSSAARTAGETGQGTALDFSKDKAFSDDVTSTGQAAMFGRYAYKTPAADTSVFDLSEANKQVGQSSAGQRQPQDNSRALPTPTEGKTVVGAAPPAERVPLLGDMAMLGHAFKLESNVQKSETLDDAAEAALRQAKNSAIAGIAAGGGGSVRSKQSLSYYRGALTMPPSVDKPIRGTNGYYNSNPVAGFHSGAAPATFFDVEDFNAIVPLSKMPVDAKGDFFTSSTNSLVAAGHGKSGSNNAQMFAYQNAKEDLEQKKHYSQILDIAAEKRLRELNAKMQPSEPGITTKDSSLAREPEDVANTAKPKPPANPLIPQPEIQTADNAYSTFSLNVSDVAFKLAAASLEKGELPDAGSMRSEEFINAFDYRDPEPQNGVAVAFASERAQYPFAQNRDLLRFSVKTAALGRTPGKPLNLVLLLDNSGSMERADRVQIIREALRVLAGQLQPQDKLSIVTFARTPQLRVDGISGSQATIAVEQVSGLTPEGGTNLEEAMNLAYATALRHYLANGVNRVVLLTDGAANLGDVSPASLKQQVESHRKQGVALDCFGIGWEGYNDDLLEELSRNGDGRYGFINTPAEAATEFAGQLAGALHVAASDVKVQVEFNPKRVTTWRQIGYAKHQLTKEQFRDNTVDAAEIAAAESGNALYVIEVNPKGGGPIATVRARYKIPGTEDYREHEWPVAYDGNALPLDQSSSAMRLAGTAGAFSEWLAASPFAGEITPDRLLGYLNGVPEKYGAYQRPKKLEWMIRQAKSLAGK